MGVEIKEVLPASSSGSTEGSGCVNPAFNGVGTPCVPGPWRKEPGRQAWEAGDVSPEGEGKGRQAEERQRQKHGG